MSILLSRLELQQKENYGYKYDRVVFYSPFSFIHIYTIKQIFLKRFKRNIHSVFFNIVLLLVFLRLMRKHGKVFGRSGIFHGRPNQPSTRPQPVALNVLPPLHSAGNPCHSCRLSGCTAWTCAGWYGSQELLIWRLCSIQRPIVIKPILMTNSESSSRACG